MPKAKKSTEQEEANELLKSMDVPPLVRLGVVKVEDRLGQGGFGSVYSAHIGGTKVAVKISHEWEGPGNQQKLLKEFETLLHLSHENICTVLGVGIVKNDNGSLHSRNLCLVMEYMPDTLSKWRGEAGPNARTRLDVISYFVDVACGLEFLHYRGAIHRDLKPENVLVKRAVAKIADVGLTRTVQGKRDSATMSKHTGTNRYMAPEVQGTTRPRHGVQATRPRYGVKADIYSFGRLVADILLNGGSMVKDPKVMSTRLSKVEDDLELRDLILDTLKMSAKKRPNATEVHLRLKSLHQAMIDKRSMEEEGDGRKGGTVCRPVDEKGEEETKEYGNGQDTDLKTVTTRVADSASTVVDKEMDDKDLSLYPSYRDSRLVSLARSAGSSQQSRKRRHSSVECPVDEEGEEETKGYGSGQDTDLKTVMFADSASTVVDKEMNDKDLSLLPSYRDSRLISPARSAGSSRQSQKRRRSSVEL